jgi:MSHA pilin protein MshA
MLKQQSGFTLIELIMVIVVLAALAVTAIPRYINLEAQAITGALNGIAGSLASGSAINFAACRSGAAAPNCLTGANMDDCADVDDTLVGAALPTGYTITAAALGASGTVTTCTLNRTTPAQTVTFSAITP